MVVEGGAMRCIFTAGVLDAIHESCYNKFDLIVSVSAGAACSASFTAGQKGRSQNIFLNYLSTRQFVNFSRLLQGDKSIMDLGYAIKEISTKALPLDFYRIRTSYTKLFLTLANAESGEAEFVLADNKNIVDALVATCNLPYLTRAPIEFQGKFYVDGGVANPIPVDHAIAMGANKIVVILTRPHGYRKKKRTLITSIMKRINRQFKELEELIQNEHEIYNSCKENVENFKPTDIELITVEPPADFTVDRLTTDKDKLLTGYAQGVIAGLELEKKLAERKVIRRFS